MRFSTSALVVVLLQNSSLLSPNDAFSPPLSRVVKSSSSLTKSDGLYAQCDDDDNDGTKKRITSSVLLGGAAFQLSTSKVSADLCSVAHHDVCSLSLSKLSLMQFDHVFSFTLGISRRKHIVRCNDRSITKQWWSCI